MADFTRNFIAGRMNKIVDQRLLPEGEYVDAMNIRMGSTENSEVGVITNTNGNSWLTKLAYTDGTALSVNAKCIGAIQDSANETLYWFVHDPTFTVGATGKLDLIVSYNVLTGILIYHVISINDGTNLSTTLNFNPSYLITGVNLIEDLLFFTDDYNPPRFININRNYANPSPNYVDYYIALAPLPIAPYPELLKEALLVIKKPPTESPLVTPIIISGQENFLNTRFISFAYRYRYIDGEYSATSQWSQVSFIPNSFEFSQNSMLNEGMTNLCNSAIVEFNSGGPLVVGLDVLFKQSNNNIIKVIERIDKADAGYSDYQTYQISFNNSKIFTILSEAELLRLYDNVPLLAKAQTIMGNRLMYGNYLEGWDLIDKNKFSTKFEYNTTLITEEIGVESLNDFTASGSYNLDSFRNVANSVLYFDLAGQDLKEGSSITIEFTISHSQFSGSPQPVETTENIEFTFTFLLTRDYTSVYALATSTEFQSAIGTTANIKPVYSAIPGTETSCDGSTLTDQINCVLPQNLDTLQKYASGISYLGKPIAIKTIPSSTQIGLQFVAMQYVNDVAAPTTKIYEYYEVVFASATFQKIANPQSLHSNRGYEIGIVYMDEFNRATTALVSPNNTEYVPCGYSANKNSIQVTIPIEQIAPAFATRYKLVIKPDAENYEVIYTNIFFTDPNTNEVWFFLEGENIQKIEVGDRLIVKADTSGALPNCAYATVLEKSSKSSGFIDPIEDVVIPEGVYMKMNPNTFSAVSNPLAVIAPGNLNANARYGGFATLKYPMNIADVNNPGMYVDYTVPSGSLIKFYIDWNMVGKANCDGRGYILDKRLASLGSYDNMEDWFNGENISNILDTGISKDGGYTSVEYISTNGILTSFSSNIVYLQFYRNPTTNQLILQMGTGKSCRGGGSSRREYNVNADIEVFRAINTIIFETEPLDALPDVWYENNLSFPIDANGLHGGNVQDQDIILGTPAIINTQFFNCFAFGNGAESYKIRDSLIGRTFSLGERVTSVSAQEYKRADRFADITYSGIYNAESNVNKLNQFNAGLLNYKNCEASFGEIFLLDGRQTDILTLQEDKISYVLAGKNLLSDSTGGGVVTSVPEVLGTQIARTEKYGISFNPESYVQWGYDRYFTDTKRGAVIQLKGGDSQSEQLVVVSEQNMRTWFRDTFNASFNTQKLGGFDPYMNEYVLSSNSILLPVNPQCLGCGISQTFTLSVAQEVSKQEVYCVDLGPLVGITEVSWNFTSIQSGATLNVSTNYNGTIVSSGPTDEAGNIFFNKNLIPVETVEITLTYTGDMVVSILADCCQTEPMTIIEVVLTNNSESGQTIHTQYRYTDGAFIGPLLSNLVFFGSGTETPLVSRYNVVSGFVGTGGFPPEYSIMRLITNAIPPDNYVFNIAQDKFRYLRTPVLYENNSVDMNALLVGSTIATPNGGAAPLYYADFTVPESINGEYLYLIWDLRDAIPAELCFGGTFKDSCCNCVPGNYYLNASFGTATAIFDDINLSIPAANGFYSTGGFVRELVDGVLLPQQFCGACGVAASLCFGTSAADVCCLCSIDCITPCNTYEVTNTSNNNVSIDFYDCEGKLQKTSSDEKSVSYICSIGTPIAASSLVDINFYACGCVV